MSGREESGGTALSPCNPFGRYGLVEHSSCCQVSSHHRIENLVSREAVLTAWRRGNMRRNLIECEKRLALVLPTSSVRICRECYENSAWFTSFVISNYLTN